MSTEELHPVSQEPESADRTEGASNEAPTADESASQKDATQAAPPADASADSSTDVPAAVATPKPKSARAKASTPVQRWYGTGRRKEAVARVYLKSGSGTIRVNKHTFEDYFPRETLRMIIEQPLKAVNSRGKFDVTITVGGGGIAGQAGAVRLGISRALLKYDETHRPSLRKAGYLTRDPRSRERKKFGQRGARRRFQWTKR